MVDDTKEMQRERVRDTAMFYGDIGAACDLVDQMGQHANEVEGILNDLTAKVTDGTVPDSKLASLVRPLRMCRHNLNDFRKLCKAYQAELQRRGEEAEDAKANAMEPLDADAEEASNTEADTVTSSDDKPSQQEE